MLIDTTLREGAQLFGAYFNICKRKEIVAGLLALGVDEIELGWIGQEGLEELVAEVRPLAGKTCISVWSPCRDTDIRTAAALDVDRVNIGVPVSDMHMEQRLGTDREGLLERLARTVLAAGLLGIPYISVGLEDFSRASMNFALRAARLAEEMGAARVRLSDSLGLFSPPELARLTRTFRAGLGVDLAVHCHNDFGMATANATTALGAGADYADCSVLGIGERSGISATEELAAYLTIKEERHGYKTETIRDLCRQVSEAAGVPIPRTKPVAGKDIFSCESGIHAHALSKSPALFEPYDPDLIGADRTVAVGGKSGRAAVANALDENDIPHRASDISKIVTAVRKLSWKLERPLTPAELSHLTRTDQGKPC